MKKGFVACGMSGSDRILENLKKKKRKISDDMILNVAFGFVAGIAVGLGIGIILCAVFGI
jgi:capsular polysaccharide biosynthesis protein